MTLIFGHKSPDTDATGAPIVWQWYLNTIKGQSAEAVVLGPPNKEALFVLDRWGFDVPRTVQTLAPGTEVVVVDTNNPGELPDGIHQACIVQIIDHHLLCGGLLTRLPIEVTIRPLACTVTVMHELMGKDAHQMPNSVKGVALSCIISDTLEFRSPTTTDTDHQLALQWADELGLDISDYAAEMFAAKSDMSSYSDTDLLKVDSKLYEVGGKKLRISVLETTTPGSIIERQKGLVEAMNKAAEDEGVDQILLFVVDILNERSTLFVPNDFTRQLTENSFAIKPQGDKVILPGVVSRKKQIIPNLQL